MWETLFDPSMLDSGKEIAIWCPRHEDVPALFEILRNAGITWWNTDELRDDDDEWGAYKSEMTYCIVKAGKGRGLAIGGRATADEEIRCIFRSECVKPKIFVEVGDLL